MMIKIKNNSRSFEIASKHCNQSRRTGEKIDIKMNINIKIMMKIKSGSFEIASKHCNQCRRTGEKAGRVSSSCCDAAKPGIFNFNAPGQCGQLGMNGYSGIQHVICNSTTMS